MTEEELLDAWRGGDRNAGNELIRSHYERVFYFFYRRLDGDADRAGELTHETFAVAIARREAIQSTFRGYVTGIAKMKLLESCRPSPEVAGHQEDAAGAFADEAPLELAPLALGGVELSIDENKVVRALRRLDTEQQILLELKYVEDFTAAEIAEAFRLTPGQAGRRLNDARAALKAAIQERAMARGSDGMRHLQSWVQSVYRKAYADYETKMVRLDKQRER